MKATAILNAILITASAQVEGQLILETHCRDFDDYQRLPNVVDYHGIICGKTGWSSDRNYACYKSKPNVAFAV